MFNQLCKEIKEFFGSSDVSVSTEYELNPEDFEKWKDSVSIEVAHKETELVENFGQKYCPLAKTNCLLHACVHFKDINVRYINGNDYFKQKSTYYFDKPKCKLWEK
jgi:hypothetical protein